MTASTPEPETPAPPRPRPTGLLRATAWVAFAGVVLALVGLVGMLRPVRTPVQDCGTALGFILDGRVNVYADTTNPPEGITRAEAKANERRPCRARVADQIRVPAMAFVAGVVLALLAGLVEVVARAIGWRRRNRQRAKAGEDDADTAEDTAEAVSSRG